MLNYPIESLGGGSGNAEGIAQETRLPLVNRLLRERHVELEDGHGELVKRRWSFSKSYAKQNRKS